MAVAILYGAVIELIVIRRLFTAPRVIVLVATIGIAQLSLAMLIALPEIDAPGARFPVPIGGVYEVADVRVVGPQVSILIVVPLVALGLGWLLNRTALGKAVKASAENPDLARLSGISPKAVSTAVWAIAGGLAALSLSLLAGQTGSAQNLDNLGPSTLVRALAAAVIAGMVSFPRAFLAGIAIGILQSVVTFNFLDQPGLMDFLVFLAVSIAVYWQSRQGRGETQTFAFGAKAKPIPERLREVWWVRQIDRIGLALLLVGALILPLVVTAALAAPALHHGPHLCALRPVAHGPHRLGRTAVARADVLRRHRCAPHRRLRPGRRRRHRLGRHPAPQWRDRAAAPRSVGGLGGARSQLGSPR